MKIRPVTGLKSPRQAVYGVGIVNGAAPGSEVTGQGAISVTAASVSGSGYRRSPVELPVGSVQFAEVPEIVFVDQHAETEELAVFLIDPSRRIVPGDLWWKTGGRLQVHPDDGGGDYTLSPIITLETVSGAQPSGLSFNATTGQLVYDGTATGVAAKDWTVRMVATTQGAIVYSEPFRIRILQPDVLYGDNAAAAMKTGWGTGDTGKITVPVDPLLGGTWTGAVLVRDNDVNNNLPVGTDAAPAVIFVAPGTYSSSRYVASKNYYYILGDPDTRPLLVGDAVDGGVNGYLCYYKNLEQTNCKTPGFAWRAGVATITQAKCYSHDWTISQNSFATVGWEGWEPNNLESKGVSEMRAFVVNSHFQRAGGAALQHPMYVEGRPTSRVQVNNCYINGGRQNSLSKTTCRFNRWLNSFFSPVVDYNDPYADVQWASKAIDAVACSRNTVYNCDFIQMYDTGSDKGGFQDGAIAWRQRNAFCGSDWPWPSYLSQYEYTINGGSLTPPLSGTLGGDYEDPEFSGLGWDKGPETYENPDFWSAVASYSETDPENPYTYKKFISYCRFTYITLGTTVSSSQRHEWMKDIGTLPRIAYVGPLGTTTGGPFFDLSAPANWSNRSVTWTGNNVFNGWTPTDAQSMETWANIAATEPGEVATKIGPGPWPDPALPRSIVYLGGDSGPHPEASVGVTPEGVPLGPPIFTDLPAWFDYGGRSTAESVSVIGAAASVTPSMTFSGNLNVPSLNFREPRVDPYNEVGSDYPSSVGGTTNGTVGDAPSYTRAWIWGSKMCWDPVRKMVLGICGPHLADDPEFGPVGEKWRNQYNSILFTYSDQGNQVQCYEAPLNYQGGGLTGDATTMSGFTSHLFDNNAIRDRVLYKVTQPVWVSGSGYIQPQVVGISIDDIVVSAQPLESAYASVRDGAAFYEDLGRPTTGTDITGCALAYHAGIDSLILFHKNRYWMYSFTSRSWSAENVLAAITGGNVEGATYYPYHNLCSYNPHSGVAVFGGGAARFGGSQTLVGNSVWHAVSANGAVTQIDDSPVVMSVFNDVTSVKCCSTWLPGTNKHIFFHDSGTVYTVDPTKPSGQQWATAGAVSTSATPADWCCAIPDYGCVLIGSYGGLGTNKLTIFKA